MPLKKRKAVDHARIITLTVNRMKSAARALELAGWGPPPMSAPGALIGKLREWADELDTYDARRLRSHSLDPSKQPKRRKKG